MDKIFKPLVTGVGHITSGKVKTPKAIVSQPEAMKQLENNAS